MIQSINLTINQLIKQVFVERLTDRQKFESRPEFFLEDDVFAPTLRHVFKKSEKNFKN